MELYKLVHYLGTTPSHTRPPSTAGAKNVDKTMEENRSARVVGLENAHNDDSTVSSAETYPHDLAETELLTKGEG